MLNMLQNSEPQKVLETKLNNVKKKKRLLENLKASNIKTSNKNIIYLLLFFLNLADNILLKCQGKIQYIFLAA